MEDADQTDAKFLTQMSYHRGACHLSISDGAPPPWHQKNQVTTAEMALKSVNHPPTQSTKKRAWLHPRGDPTAMPNLILKQKNADQNKQTKRVQKS